MLNTTTKIRAYKIHVDSQGYVHGGLQYVGTLRAGECLYEIDDGYGLAQYRAPTRDAALKQHRVAIWKGYDSERKFAIGTPT